MDWIRLTNSGVDLAGQKVSAIGLEELAKHNRKDDAWIAIRGTWEIENECFKDTLSFTFLLGKVYNITSYFEFHPGGEEELMRGVGIDATELFDQVNDTIYNYKLKLIYT